MWLSIISLKGSSPRHSKLFVWKNIITQFGIIQFHLLFDNKYKKFYSLQHQELSLYFLQKKKKKRTISLPSPTQCYWQTEASNKTIIDGMKKILEGVMRNWLTRTSTPRRSIERLPLLWLMEWGSHLLRIWIWICNSSFHTLRIQTPREYMYY